MAKGGKEKEKDYDSEEKKSQATPLHIVGPPTVASFRTWRGSAAFYCVGPGINIYIAGSKKRPVHVELRGFEPLTSALRTQHSPN